MRECEICGNELKVHQQRFCCRKCRNTMAGRVSAAKFKLPDRERLAQYYLLPPNGQGLSFEEIGKIYGVSDVTIRNWIIGHGLLEDGAKRQRYHRKKQVGPRIPRPPKSELEKLYQMPPNGEGLTQDQLAARYDVDRGTARRWLQFYNLLEPHSERHSKRMAGTDNPAYTNGNSQRYVKRQLAAIKEKRCDWCGTTKRVEIHHINHDRENNDLDNLTWLCANCNKLEAQLWLLEQDDRATISWENQNGQQILVIQFTERSE